MRIEKILTISTLIFFSALTVFTQPQKDIRKVDFKNFTYNLSCGDADKVTPVRVKNSEYHGDKNGIDVYLTISDVQFGDINGDGKEEAIIRYGCGSGASYFYVWGLIFTIKDNKPILLADIKGGNKADGGISDIKIVRNLLVVERLQAAENAGSPCCPHFIETTIYRLKGRRLIQVGKQITRKFKENE